MNDKIEDALDNNFDMDANAIKDAAQIDFEPQAAIDSTQIAPASNIYNWYVLHTYSGYETMVKQNLEMVFKKNNLESRLSDIMIPLEDVVEEKNGRKKVVKRRLLPCYVFIKMDYDNSLWHMITKTRGVTGFVGPQGRALPLTSDEIKKMRLETVQVIDTKIQIGDRVRIMGGSFEGNEGNVTNIDNIKGKAKLEVEAFGRLTQVDVELFQIESI